MGAKNRSKIIVLAAAMIVLVPAAFVFAQTATSTASTSSLSNLINQLQEQIRSLQTQVVELQSQLETVKTELKFTKALQRGASGEEVKALQEFLKGFPDIYPEGLVTGYYGALTERAVKRLQEKQGLEPVGALGPRTRARLNELITQGAGSSGPIPPGLMSAPGLRMAPETTAQGTTTPSGTIPATPAVPIGETGTTTVPAIPATPATSAPSALATTTPTMTCGRTLNVPSDKYPNIQSALDASCIGDVIRIASGAYFGKFNLASKHSGITITGAGLSETVIQGSGSWVFYINGLKNAAIKNLTIVRGGGRNIDGGGVWIAGSENVVLEGCRISESAANQGGALAIQNSSVTITRCLFDHNTAYNSAGGIIIRDNSRVTITNATIAYNTALGCHGGGLFTGNSTLSVKNSILWGNAASQPPGSGCGWGPAIYGDPTVSYSDIQFGFKGTGNIDSNPYFVSSPGGDYHLSSPSSPAYNSGDPSALDPDGTRADMGVFPYGVTALAPAIVPTPTPTLISIQTSTSTAGATTAPATTTTTATATTTPAATTATTTTATTASSTGATATTATTAAGYAACGQNVKNVPGDYATIQRAIDAASAGDTVRVAAGTYAYSRIAPAAPYYVDAPIIMKSGICLEGAGIDRTIITVPGTWGIYMSGVSYATIKNLTVKGSGHLKPGSGGGVSDGGGIFITNSNNVQLESCRLTDNEENNGGGLALLYSSGVTVSRCLIDHNYARNVGGGMSLSASSVTLTNVTVAHNTASYTGYSIDRPVGGIYTASQTSTAVKNSILWGNSGYDLYPPSLSGVSYSDIGTPNSGTGNISSDPRFVSISDYRLQSTSPVINAGDPSLLDSDGSRSDMGAYPLLGITSLTTTLTATTTTTAPAAPGSPTSGGASNGRVTFSWTDKSSDETRFEIHKGTAFSGPYAKIGEVGGNVTSFSYQETAAGFYYYRVAACNSAGCSNWLDLGGMNVSVPVSSATCAETVINGYPLLSRNNGESVTIGKPSAQVPHGTQFTYTNFTCNNGTFTSNGSEWADIRCDSGYQSMGIECVATISQVQGLAATVSGTSVNLSWQAVTGISYYTVHHGWSADFDPLTEPSGASNLIAAGNILSYTHSTTDTGTHYYKVVAQDANGFRGPASSAASATISAPASAADCIVSFKDGKTTYVISEIVTYTYTCTVPAGGSVTVKVVDPNGIATTYNSWSGGTQTTQTLGFGTASMTAGNYTLQVCTSGCVSLPFTMVLSAGVPPIPLNLTASMASYSTTTAKVVALIWTGGTSGITEFRLFSRAQGSSWPASYDRRGLELLVGIMEVHIGLPGGASGVYEFKVQACNSAGCSADSNVASVNTSGTSRLSTSSTLAFILESIAKTLQTLQQLVSQMR